MIIDAEIKPQPMTLNSVHAEYGRLTAEEVRDRARSKLQEWIAAGQGRAERTVNSIFDETPTDLYAPAAAIKVDAEEGKNLFRALIADRSALGMHQHGLDQLAERVGFNTRFLHDLQGKRDSQGRPEAWSHELGARIFNDLLQHRPRGEKYLIRQVKDQGRAVLSDAYKCIDSRPTAEELVKAAQANGAVLIDGTHSQTRVSIKVVRPELVELFPGEWAVLGFGYSNSDFGDGAAVWDGFIQRLLCLNGAMVTTKFRSIHLGRRAGNDVLLSERTRRLMSEGDKSAARDLVRGLLSKESTDRLVEQVRAAHAKVVEAGAIDAFLKTRVNKGEAEAIKAAFTSADIVEVPPGQNAWRFSNSISLVARNTEDGRKKMDLERLAGDALAFGKAA
jgi:hypothetical protein